jgi:uncharacterized membrane protein
MMGYSAAAMPLMWLWMLVGLALVAVSIALLVVGSVRLADGGRHGESEAHRILAARFASGEIGAQQYTDDLKTLRWKA